MNLPIVSTGSGSVVEGRGAVPLELCGMDRECSCPGHQARDEVGVLGDIDLDTSSVEVSIDDDDLAAREAETAAVTSRL